ncbi:MAG: hypothetical protein BRD30_08735 [Bacteroidetes bacterium QH_2_63_10]|nr:MAG: hypothetical protein BRD30_08735 [Bacteroidetes bacterium QH_2_63_10]
MQADVEHCSVDVGLEIPNVVRIGQDFDRNASRHVDVSFEQTLDRYPARALALMGKAKAAARAGKTELAQKARTTLTNQWTDADASVQAQLRTLDGTTTSSASGSK